MAYMPKLNHIAGACALLFIINHAIAQNENELSPVVVTGEKGTGYVAKNAMIAGPGGTQEVSLKDSPTSITVITRDLLDDKQVKVMSEAVRLDASIGDYYSPIGYYENLYIRGFALDPATSFKVNGLTVTGEQNIAFENKERMEILKGVSALEVGAASPGGIVNFVTKRPKEVMSVTVGTGERGTAYTSVDYGTFFDEAKTLGIRINAAHENIRPYVPGAEGKRDFASIALDAKISNKTKVEFDFEYQNKSQRSVPALMMLGGEYSQYDPSDNFLGSGATPLSFPKVSPDIMLGRYSWVPPTETISTNANLKVTHQLDTTLKTFFNLSHSEVKINDQSLYAYGCTSSDGQNGGSIYYTNFCPNGNYDAYDFRSMGEIRKNNQMQAGLTGNNQWLGMKHSWSIGLDELVRSVFKGNSIYYLVGTDNLTQASNITPTPADGGVVYKILDHSQSSLFLNDQIDLNKQAKLFAGLRFMQMKQKAYEVTNGNAYAELNKWWTLPQLGLSYAFTPQLTSYISFSRGVEPGTIALADSFVNRTVMPPKKTEQYEIGSKYALDTDSLLTFAFFQTKRPNEFSIYDSGILYKLYQEGTVTNRGVEASLAKRLTNRLNLLASAMYLQADQSGAVTDPTQNGKQAIGIPHWRSIVNADYLIPNYERLSIQGSWTYSSAKPIDLKNTMQAPSYNKFDAGLKYIDRVGKSQASYRIFVENVFNKFYWRDVSQSFGANMLYPGAPRIVRATATFDF